MTIRDAIPIILFLCVLTLAAVLLGGFMTMVFTGKRTFLTRIAGPTEKFLYRLFGVDKEDEMSWKTYTLSLVIFNAMGIVVLFVLQLTQGVLPFNPQRFGAVRWDTALNTAISFVTNTNWQAYGGEQTMSYFTQMVGITVQNFLSAAVGLAAVVALIRGFIRKSVKTIGNFWVDLTRAVLYVLLPLAIIWALVLASQGVVQTLSPATHVQTLEGREQIIAVGPVASQVAIKQLGTNGGGFFNANSAHPFESPTPLTDFMEVFALLLIPAALPFMLGGMLKKRRQGWAFFAAMMVLFLLGLTVTLWAEAQGSPILEKMGILHGANMEGKEARFGVVHSILFAQSTTATACGAVNSMHDSLMPLSGLVLLFNMAIGEVIFGGVGVGLVGMIIYAILTMFLAGLMIGRTPEFIGKKLEPYEMIMSVIAILSSAIVMLVLASLAIATRAGLAGLNNAGPHGLSEILYAYASTANNNGSAFAGLNANTPFYNLTTACAMLVGRFTTIIPALAIAGSLAKKKVVPISAGIFPTTNMLFVVMLVSVVIIVGALTFFPALTLGPLLEHLFVQVGKTF
ncbi:MAG: potassium-transporting ATPase subunit KdpA [Deltaproteobacteria bacterium RBG_16_54_18]|nr:MAG: potassium-transporting ATPase subunit KdpA [Deltaproteobacteria bacterium RBG_16_54_18]